jgi:hypothetical protein
MISPSNYPTNMTPLPEAYRDYLVLGWGSSFLVPANFQGIALSEGANNWNDDSNWSGLSTRRLYAAPPNSAIVRANLPQLPEGARILGLGGSFSVGEIFRGWAISEPFAEWREGDHWSGTSEENIYAIMETPQSAPAPTRSFMLPLPSACLLAIPEGQIYLGTGGEFETGGERFRGRYGTHRFGLEGNQSGHQTDYHYCAPANSNVVRMNLPPLPEGFAIVGYGSALMPPINGGYRLNLESPDPTWEGPGDFAGKDWDSIYAVREAPAVEDQLQEVQVEQPQQQKAALQWHVVIGGQALSTCDEVRVAASPLVSDSNNLLGVTNAIDEAMRVSDPDLFIESWIDKEPALISMLEWVPLSSTQGVDIHAIAESNATIADVITKAAAGVMLRGGFSSHFRYLEDGTLAIDPSSPPTVDQAYELLRRTLEIKETASKLDNYSAWMLGMIADQFEVYFGERFDPSVIMQQTSRAYNTYVCSLGTFRAWWTEKRNLSFTHHREVQYAKHLDHDTGGRVLDLSERFKLTVLQQRKLISYAKRFDIANLEGEMGEMGELEEGDVEGLMERIDIRAVNKRYLFFLRTTNKWFEYKGPFENIPNGASPIINADTRQIMGQDGQATKPDEWIPVGVIASPAALESVGFDVEDEEDEEDES